MDARTLRRRERKLPVEWFYEVPLAFYVFCAGLFGAAWGSFFHVCVVRIPEEQSVVHPPSYCPQCQQPISWFDNFPLFSYLVLGGHCRHCKSKIPPRYFIFECLSALAFMGIVAKFGLSTATIVYLLLVSDLLVISGIDWDHQYIPDFLSVPMTPIAVALAGLAQWSGVFPLLLVQDVGSSLLGVAVGGGVIWGIRALGTLAFGQEAMGFGDVKLMAFLGGFLGWENALVCIFLASFIGSLVGVSMRMLGRLEQYGKIPFGPYLALGAYGCLLFGPEIVAWYVAPFQL